MMEARPSDRGVHDPVSDGAVRQSDNRGAVVLGPSGGYGHGPGDLLCGRDDAISVCPWYPHFRLSSDGAASWRSAAGVRVEHVARKR